MPVALLGGWDPGVPCAASAFALLEMSSPAAQAVLGVCCLHSSVAPREQNDVLEVAEMPLWPGLGAKFCCSARGVVEALGALLGAPTFWSTSVSLILFGPGTGSLLLTPAAACSCPRLRFVSPAAPSTAREYIFQHLPFQHTVLQPDIGSGLGKLPVSRGCPSFCSDQSSQQAGLWHVVLASVLEFKGCCEGGSIFFPFMFASVQLKTQTAAFQEYTHTHTHTHSTARGSAAHRGWDSASSDFHGPWGTVQSDSGLRTRITLLSPYI